MRRPASDEHQGRGKGIQDHELCAGAYWRGDEHRAKCLPESTVPRYPKEAELDAYLTMMEEAKKRDHRKLGKELEPVYALLRRRPGLPLLPA